jgi:hypothetical protein
MSKKRRRRLTSARNCRQYLSDVAHRMDSGDLDAAIGGKIAYCINIILKSLELDEIERRITALEEKTDGKAKTFTSYQD